MLLSYPHHHASSTPTTTVQNKHHGFPIYEEMSKEVVSKFAKGVPLALKVLGCHLCSKSTEEWESELKKLEIRFSPLGNNFGRGYIVFQDSAEAEGIMVAAYMGLFASTRSC